MFLVVLWTLHLSVVRRVVWWVQVYHDSVSHKASEQGNPKCAFPSRMVRTVVLHEETNEHMSPLELGQRIAMHLYMLTMSMTGEIHHQSCSVGQQDYLRANPALPRR
jgi:hypothetical protein